MKYIRTFFLALQKEFNSRANIAGWFIVGAIPSIILVLVWLAVLGDKTSINGFTKGDFIVYYLFITFSWYIVGGTFSYQLGNSIKYGGINTSLLKPYNVVISHFIKEQAWKVISIIVAIPPSFLIVYIYKDYIHINLSVIQICMLLISLILGSLIFALLEALAGLCAFWISEVWPITYLYEMLQSLFGGRLVPLTLMPPAILYLSNILPFKYTFYVPVSILLLKSSNIYLDVSIQALYVLLLYVIYRVVWNRGIRKYEAAGV